MNRLHSTGFLFITIAGWLTWATTPPGRQASGSSPAPDGWTTAAPREEIRPAFAYEAAGGADGKGVFAIKADGREGLDGCWTKTYPVAGGKHYRFQTFYQAREVAVPRRSIVVK